MCEGFQLKSVLFLSHYIQCLYNRNPSVVCEKKKGFEPATFRLPHMKSFSPCILALAQPALSQPLID